MTPSRDIKGLLDIMAALRHPETGCAWDLKQTFATIAPYTLEEAAEVADAIARNDMPDLREELGDLLLQVVFHAQMADEAGAFAFPDVVEAITTKLIRRHPHVFGETRHLSPEEIKTIWDRIKAEEKAERAAKRGSAEPNGGLLDGVQTSLPSLSRAVALQAKAGTVGFDWNDARMVLAKIREEADEVEETLSADATDEQRLDEIGDLLFAVANLARHMKADPEVALRRANAKFERRFRFIEAALAAEGKTTAGSSLAEMDALWDEAKLAERQPV
ncbi:nucleoside triphosphate pyrophosphohydrolase [Flaviflagellibacter deserti]|uniref:Nucleoside triphosphate pyrophosphohydrolase n=1 Tax=Flaviflagellibacter deserti TaxID=2267266 RepID=A0ABV9Z3S2_9HYPH